MSGSGLFARLMGGAAATAVASVPAAAEALSPGGAAPTPPAPAAAPTEAQIETALQAARAEGVTEGTTAGTAAGATAERERTNAVLTSDAGKKNMSTAAWMLSSSPTASAESIIAHLAGMPEGIAAPAAAAAITTPLAATPLANLGNSGGNDGGAGNGPTKAEKDALWDSAIVAAAGDNRLTAASPGTFKNAN